MDVVNTSAKQSQFRKRGSILQATRVSILFSIAAFYLLESVPKQIEGSSKFEKIRDRAMRVVQCAQAKLQARGRNEHQEELVSTRAKQREALQLWCVPQ